MQQITRINADMTRLVLPYKDIYTTIYVLRSAAGVLIFDTATTDEDMEEGLFPLLRELEIMPEEVRGIVISHNHRDHAGGLPRLLQELPQVPVFSRCPKLKERFGDRVVPPADGDRILDVYQAVAIPGHTLDSMGLLDRRTNTLITGDSLQLYGIYGSGEWGANITWPAEHLQALERVRKLKPDGVYCAHDYHPCGYFARGCAEIDRMLQTCEEPLYRIRDLLCGAPELDDGAVRALYHSNTVLPTVPVKVVTAIRAAMGEGRL